MAHANPNELRALALLSEDLHRDVRPWLGKWEVAAEMLRQADLPAIGATNDGAWLWLSRDPDACDELGCLSPDGWFIEQKSNEVLLGWNPRCHHLCLVEVEHTSPMHIDKVLRYGMLFDYFWMSSAWELHLIIFDEYDQWRELDLLKFYHRNFRERDPQAEHEERIIRDLHRKSSPQAKELRRARRAVLAKPDQPATYRIV